MEELIPDVSEKQLKFGYWWLSNRLKVRALALLGVYILLGILYLYLGYQFFSYFRSSDEYQATLSELSQDYINYTDIHRLTAPRPLIVESVQVIQNRSALTDLVVKVRNPNGRWWLKDLEYGFTYGSTRTEMSHISFLPGETKYLYAFGVTGVPTGAYTQVALGKHVWQRVKDSTQLSLSNNWIAPEFAAENISYVKHATGQVFSIVQFDLDNFSPYNLWNVDVQVALLSGSKVVGFNTISLENVESGEVRPVELVWNENVPTGVQPEVIISADTLSDSNIRISSDTFSQTGSFSGGE